MDVETFLCQSRKKISFSKINLLNLRKNLVGPWGSTQLGERNPKPVSHPKSDTRKVSHPSGPQNHPTCTCTPVPRVSARDSPLLQEWHGQLKVSKIMPTKTWMLDGRNTSHAACRNTRKRSDGHLVLIAHGAAFARVTVPVDRSTGHVLDA